MTNGMFFKRYKTKFTKFHSSIYDLPFNCNSHVISFIYRDDIIQYGKIKIFLSRNKENFVCIQKYGAYKKRMSDYVELHHRINIYFSIMSLSNNFTIIHMAKIRHKCILVPMSDSFCISEIRMDYEHD